MTTSNEVEVDVVDGLSAMLARIDYGAITLV